LKKEKTFPIWWSDNNRDKVGKHLYLPVLPEKYEEALLLLKEKGYVSTK
jgi:hypothetical protein